MASKQEVIAYLKGLIDIAKREEDRLKVAYDDLEKENAAAEQETGEQAPFGVGLGLLFRQADAERNREHLEETISIIEHGVAYKDGITLGISVDDEGNRNLHTVHKGDNGLSLGEELGEIAAGVQEAAKDAGRPAMSDDEAMAVLLAGTMATGKAATNE